MVDEGKEALAKDELCWSSMDSSSLDELRCGNVIIVEVKGKGRRVSDLVVFTSCYFLRPA